MVDVKIERLFNGWIWNWVYAVESYVEDNNHHSPFSLHLSFDEVPMLNE